MTDTHPLGPLAPLAADAQEWRTRNVGGGSTWAGLWHPDQRSAVEATITEHTFALDESTIARLARADILPGVRDYAPLIALLLSEDEQIANVDPDTGRLILPVGAAEEVRAAVPFGIPIWHHGDWDKAQLTPVRHAVHVQRWLDDYHEPTLAALCRRRLRRVRDRDDQAAVSAAREAATQEFLDQPTRWRQVVEQAVHLATVRDIEAVLHLRLKGPGRTVEQLQAKIDEGLGMLAMGSGRDYWRIKQALENRLASLQRSKVVLMYEEHEYLQLTGVQDGRSTRRHLPRGLHLVFSDQSHRRTDRTADLWLAGATPERNAGAYYWEPDLPPRYAARKRSAPFRLADEGAVWRYAERGEGEE